MMARRRLGEIETTVYIDTYDLIDRLSDDDLLAELTERGLSAHTSYCPIAATEASNPAEVYRGWAQELRLAAKERDWVHFEVLLLRMSPTEMKEAVGRVGLAHA
jgi:hypothetical protein